MLNSKPTLVVMAGTKMPNFKPTLRRLHDNDPTLTTVYLSIEGSGNEGVQALAEALKTNSTLELLFLTYDQRNDVVARALADVFRTNPSLKDLGVGLRHTGISDGWSDDDTVEIITEKLNTLMQSKGIDDLNFALGADSNNPKVIIVASAPEEIVNH